MLTSKHSFWEALVIALIIFWTGILIGIYFENYRVYKIEKSQFDSQTDVFDFESASEIISGSDLNCSLVINRSIFFADEIYKDAEKLEKYDNSNKITEELVYLHRRYDLLRTLLWRDIIKNNERCSNESNIIVYLYNYKDPTMETKAIQGAMSNYLTDLKLEYEDKLILIPIAADTDINTLTMMREKYQLNQIPVIFVNQKYKFESLDSLKGIKDILNK